MLPSKLRCALAAPGCARLACTGWTCCPDRAPPLPLPPPGLPPLRLLRPTNAAAAASARCPRPAADPLSRPPPNAPESVAAWGWPWVAAPELDAEALGTTKGT